MKKKLISVILTVSMVGTVVLSGCGAKEEPPRVAPEPAVAPTEAPAPESESLPEEEEEVLERGDYISDCPEIVIENQTFNSYDEDENWLIESYYPTVTVYNAYEDTEPVQKTLDSMSGIFDQYNIDKIEEINRMLDEGDELLGNLERSPEIPLTSTFVEAYVSRVDSNVISLLTYFDYFAGGAHPSYEFDGWVIDAHTGDKLGIEDILKDTAGFEEYAVNKALDEAAEMSDSDDIMFYDDYESTLRDIMNCRWYLDATGIEFIYNPDEIAPYACGFLTFNMPYHEILNYMDAKYIPNIEDGVLALPFGQECQTTVINGMMASLVNSASAETDYKGESYIRAGKTRFTILENGYIEEAYIYKRLEKIYVLCNYYDNDRYNFGVFDITDGDVKEVYAVSDMGFDRDTLTQDEIKLLSEDESEEKLVNTEEIFPFN